MEIDSMVELVRRYDVDGIHFDYIRYPDGDHCFCGGCRERFARALAPASLEWPRDVLAGGAHRQAWLDWRRDNITKVVQSVGAQTRALKPGVKLSAAVFSNWSTDRDTVGQDWSLWCQRRYLDFVCPMDYTASDAQFDNWIKQQQRWAAGVPCYPGIGAWVLTSDRVIGQIQIARRHKHARVHGLQLRHARGPRSGPEARSGDYEAVAVEASRAAPVREAENSR